MLFSSLEFILTYLPAAIFLVVCGRFHGIRGYLGALIIASVIFYARYKWPGIGIIYAVGLLLSVLFNLAVSYLISEGRRRWLFFTAIALNVSLLALFKYPNFLIENFNLAAGQAVPLVDIELPLAISFITFEQIAFLSDVHSGRAKLVKPSEYFAFMTLFPKLIAGPILRYTEMYPQFRNLRPYRLGFLLTGFCIFCFGLFKKVVFADPMGVHADFVFGRATAGLMLSSSDALFGILAYALQIYFDFSGYSDMAIGLAWMMGLRLPINFLSPYKATSIIDFWRRWHITLSAFLRDYIYFPLGGGRKGKARRYVNLMCVMLLGGLWHGAAWTFVLWGAIHGLALCVNHGWRAVSHTMTGVHRIISWSPISWLMTFSLVLAAWVIFRAPDFFTVSIMYASLWPNGVTSHLGLAVIATICIGITIALFAPNTAEIFDYVFERESVNWANLPDIKTPARSIAAVAAGALCVALIILASGSLNAFIYFQF